MKKRLLTIVCAVALCPLLLLAQYSPFNLAGRTAIALEAVWTVLGGTAVAGDGGVYDLQTRTALAAEGIQAALASAAATKTALGIQAGTNIVSADSTVTQVFATAFSAAPYVVMNRFTADTITNTALVSVSKTNFIAWGQTNSPFHWVAIGTP